MSEDTNKSAPWYNAANVITDLRLIRDAQDRTKRWLWDQLIAAGLDRTIEPCQVVPDFHAEGSAWKLVGARCWCGNARLSSSRSLTVVWSETQATVLCQSYGGHKTYGVGNGATVEEAIKNLLSEPRRGGVPAAFLAGVASCL